MRPAISAEPELGKSRCDGSGGLSYRTQRMTRVSMALMITGLVAITVFALGIGIASLASVHRRRASRSGEHGWSDSHLWFSADGTADCGASSGSAGADCGGGDGGGGAGSD